MKTLLEQIEEDERTSAIEYNLGRIQTWKRRPGLTFGKRAPGLWARLLAWLGL